MTIESYDTRGAHGDSEVRCACGHAFHSHCLALWFLRSGKVTCPTCSGKAVRRREKTLRRVYRGLHTCALLMLTCVIAQSWHYAFVALAYCILMLCTNANIALIVVLLSLAWAPQEFLKVSFDTCAIMATGLLIFVCTCVTNS